MRTRGSAENAEETFDISKDEQKLLEFVNQKLEEMKKLIRISETGNLTFFELNNALMEYGNINLGLISLYEVNAVPQWKRAQDEFDTWYAKKFLLIRERENPRSQPKNKWSSKDEIDMIIRVECSEEYRYQKEKVTIAEMHKRFVQKLCENWSSHQFILNSLSKNLQAEVSGLNVSG